MGALVTRAICELVRGLAAAPSFLVAKGGITSNDVAVHALGVRRAAVLGAVRPGVPVWRLGAESARRHAARTLSLAEPRLLWYSTRPSCAVAAQRAPGLAYVVFPGNVGAPDDLARVACILSGRGDEVWPPPDAAAAAAAAEGGAARSGAAAQPVAWPRGEALLETLQQAQARGEAVGAFNVYNLEGVRAVRRAVERVGAPAICQLHPASSNADLRLEPWTSRA